MLNNAKVIIKSDVNQHIMTMDGGNRRGVDMEQTVNDLVQESKLLEAYYNDVVAKESVLHRLYEESHNSFEALRSLSSEYRNTIISSSRNRCIC